MRIVLWIGNEPNQKALANRIEAAYPIAAIVTETRKAQRKLGAKMLAEKVVEKLFLSAIGKAWWGMLQHYNKLYPSYPAVPTLDVENINSDEAYQFTLQHQPDLIIVSGTRLVKEKMLAIAPSIGILNLHTGLSPYVKGGPNCTNWCIATEQFHLIGNTIMWIDKGIDTGNILATEFTPITGNENLSALHLKVMDHAHDLYVRAIAYLAKGERQSIPQSTIAKGTTYYTKQWTLAQKFKLVGNFGKLKNKVQSGEIVQLQKEIKTVGLK
ncbi:MAG: hypothetical protein JST49_01755 [Bacteroidetes bacterium]|mgnify:CR=1 FL=1|nr:hypothetical protein [Bacteroidota bacterium]